MTEKTIPNQAADKERSQYMGMFLCVAKPTPENPGPVNEQVRAFVEDFALPKLSESFVKDLDGTEYSALKYAYMLWFHAEQLVNIDHDPGVTNDLLTTSLLVALQECCPTYANSYESYGSDLVFDIEDAGFAISEEQYRALLAQEGNWDTNRNKSTLLDGSKIAVGIYCARLISRCYSLRDRHLNDGSTADMLEKIQEGTQSMETPAELIEFYMTQFAVPYLQAQGCTDADAAKQVAKFMRSLDRSDFYRAPCSTKYHLANPGGLAAHTANVLLQMLWLTLPATKEQIGACVLAAVGHDLCKINVYKEGSKSKKYYLAEGDVPPEGVQVKSDQGGQFYWGTEVFYTFEDANPIGHGRKSAWLLKKYFFPKIGRDVYSAVDGHMADAATNKRYLYQLAESPLALRLHLADVLATYLDEAGL